jgi:hypothetical protein
MTHSIDASTLIGTWKLVSFAFVTEDGSQSGNVFDEYPIGYLILTGKRMMTLLTAGSRTPDSDGAALFNSMMAYSGKYRVEGDSFITTVDAAWHPAWFGTEQVRFCKIENHTLSISSAPQHHPKFPGGLVRGIVVWRKE